MTPSRTADTLRSYLNRCASLRFDWARWNCVDFAAGWVLQATGRGLKVALPHAQTPREWRAAMQQVGGMLAHTSSVLGVDPLPHGEARTGDLVMLPGRMVGRALGVRCVDQIACLGYPGGIAMRPLEEAIACWPLDQVALAGATA
jgi:hypothetical protein